MPRVVVFLLIASVGFAAPVPKALKNKPPELAGRWRLVELNMGGHDYSKFNPQMWEIGDDGQLDRIHLRDRPQGLTDPKVRITPVKGGKAGEVDYVFEEGGVTTTCPAIALVQDDEFVICIGDAAHNNRPTEFKSADWVTLYRFTRVEK